MDMNVLDAINIHDLGKELQRARKNKGLTQAIAAKILGVARTTITAIEKGERKIRAGELIKLAQAYELQVSDLVRPRPKIEPFQVQFRGPLMSNADDRAQITPYIETLEEISRDYLELEEITGKPLTYKYPPEYNTDGLKAELVAEEIAIQERLRLGLGDGPIPILRDMLEQEVGLRIFYLPLKPTKFSAIYLYDHKLGGCIAVNSLHPEVRRRWSLAHDYGHFLAHRYKPTIFVEGYQRIPRSEQIADYFALYFLMPSSGIKRRYGDLRQTSGKITLADLLTLAHYYGVSVEALTLRLEDLKLLPTGKWDEVRARGFKVQKAQQQLGLGSTPTHDERLPIRYQYLAVDAFERELITEGQLARFLRVDRLKARQHMNEAMDDTSIELDLAQSLDV